MDLNTCRSVFHVLCCVSDIWGCGLWVATATWLFWLLSRDDNIWQEVEEQGSLSLSLEVLQKHTYVTHRADSVTSPCCKFVLKIVAFQVFCNLELLDKYCLCNSYCNHIGQEIFSNSMLLKYVAGKSLVQNSWVFKLRGRKSLIVPSSQVKLNASMQYNVFCFYVQTFIPIVLFL